MLRCCSLPPQVARDQPYNETVDVFGFGVLLYEVFARDLVAASYVADNTMQVAGAANVDTSSVLNPDLLQVGQQMCD